MDRVSRFDLRTRLIVLFTSAALVAALTSYLTNTGIVASALLTVALAFGGIEWLLARRLRSLADTLERLRDASQTALITGREGDEMARISGAVDHIATALRTGRAEQQVTDSRFSTIVNIALDAIISVDDNQRIILFNRGAEQTFGYRAEEVMGQTLDLLIPARFAQTHWDHVREFGSGSISARQMNERRAIIGRHRDGREFPAEASISRIIDGGRTIYTTILRDITERTRAEAALRKSESRLAEAQRVGHLGSWELDLINNALWWSDEVYRMFEIDPQQFGASYEAFLATVHPEDREFVNRAYQESLRTRTPYDIVHKLMMKDGRVKYVHERCETEYGADGTAVRSIGTVLDITERKHAEDVVQQIAEGVSAVTGSAFFRSLLKHLAQTLQTEYAFVGGFVDGRLDRIRTLSVHADGQVADNFEYELRGTPCEDVVRQAFCAHPEEVQKRYPRDRLLAEMGVQSYLGIPLFDSSGHVMGLMAVMGRHRFRNVPLGESLLRIFAVRASAELERQQMVDQLATALKEIEHVTESIPDMLCMLDSDARLIRWNYNVEAATGRTRAELDRAPLIDLIAAEERDTAFEATRRGLAEGVSEVEAHLQRKDGTSVPYHWRFASLKHSDGRVAGLVGIGRDITKDRYAEETIRQLAYYDSLTMLPNRVMAQERLEQALRSGERRQAPVTFLLMDLNDFKDINNTLGHHHGDLLLKEIGPRLHGILRQSDTVARLGGDEFALVLPDTDLEGALRVAKKAHEVLAAPFKVEGLNIAVEASIGIACFPDHGTTASVLMQRADVAMYAAKHSGGGSAVYAAERDHYSARRLALMGELRYAIEHNELALFYQPKIHMQTRRVIGVEALLRWKHPHRGVIAPDEFIPLAERSGLIRPLTQWVLSAALDQARAWEQAGFQLSVAVNLSARNLLDAQLPDHLVELLRRTGTPPDRLELEITESTIMVDPARASEVLTRLHHMGISLAIDDFGTGYSSLGYLKRLPVSAVKIDKSFVKNMEADDNDAVIVRSTVELAHNLGLQVIAEGVETSYLWERLAALGCDAAQGYYVSQPMPAEALSRWFVDSPWQVTMVPPTSTPKAA